MSKLDVPELKNTLTPYVLTEITEKYNDAMKYRYNTFSELKCLECKGELVYNSDGTELEGKHHFLYSITCDEGIMYVCTLCERYYNICEECYGKKDYDLDDYGFTGDDVPIQLCKFLGFDCFRPYNLYCKKEGIYFRPNKPRKFINNLKKINEENNEHDESEESEEDVLGDDNERFIGLNENNTTYLDNEILNKYKDETIDYEEIIPYWLGDEI